MVQKADRRKDNATEQQLLHGSRSPKSSCLHSQKTITTTRHRYPPPQKNGFYLGPALSRGSKTFQIFCYDRVGVG